MSNAAEMWIPESGLWGSILFYAEINPAPEIER